MGAERTEHSSELPENQGVAKTRGTESGTLGGDSATHRQPADPDLADVVKAWPDLPVAVNATTAKASKSSDRTANSR